MEGGQVTSPQVVGDQCGQVPAHEGVALPAEEVGGGRVDGDDQVVVVHDHGGQAAGVHLLLVPGHQVQRAGRGVAGHHGPGGRQCSVQLRGDLPEEPVLQGLALRQTGAGQQEFVTAGLLGALQDPAQQPQGGAAAGGQGEGDGADPADTPPAAEGGLGGRTEHVAGVAGGEQFLRVDAQPVADGSGEGQFAQDRVPVVLGGDVQRAGQVDEHDGDGVGAGERTGRGPPGGHAGPPLLQQQFVPDPFLLAAPVGPVPVRECGDHAKAPAGARVGRAGAGHRHEVGSAVGDLHADPVLADPDRHLHLGAGVQEAVRRQFADQQACGVQGFRGDARRLEDRPHEAAGGGHAVRPPPVEPPGTWRSGRRRAVHGPSLHRRPGLGPGPPPYGGRPPGPGCRLRRGHRAPWCAAGQRRASARMRAVSSSRTSCRAASRSGLVVRTAITRGVPSSVHTTATSLSEA